MSSGSPLPPSHDPLKNLYVACDPFQPARDDQYVDTSAARGGSSVVRKLLEHVRFATDDRGYARTFVCALLSGHIGGGKSSELNAFAACLQKPEQSKLAGRYLPIHLNAEDYLDPYDADSEEFFLALVLQLAATLRDQVGIELKENYLVKRWDEIKTFLLTDVELQEGGISLGAAAVKFGRISRDPVARRSVREHLRPRMSSLLTEINQVLEAVRPQLRKKKPKDGGDCYVDVVIIVDDLEKVVRFGEQKSAEDSWRTLFVDRARQLNGLDAHVLYTVPLGLVRACGTELGAIYGREPVVLPMIKTEERATHHPYAAGLVSLREILRKRAGDTSLDDIFAPEALTWLLDFCGGDVRGLMKFVRAAVTTAAGSQVTLRDAQQALSETISLFSTSIPKARWPKLAALDRSSDQQMDNGDADTQIMLRQLEILEYVNGGDGDDPFAEAAPWYAVHPIVRRLPQFRAAAAALDAQAKLS